MAIGNMLKQINPLKVSLHSIQRSLEITKTFYMLIFTNIISFLVFKEKHTGIDITWLIHVNNIVFVSYQIKNSLHELCFHKVVQ